MTPYYDERGITIFHGDCQQIIPALHAVNLVLMDPPYGTTQLDWDIAPDWAALWPMLYHVCTPTALQVAFSAQPFTTDLINSNRKRFRYDLVWPKPTPTGFLDANRRPLRAHETILVFAEKFGGSTYKPQKTPCRPERKHRSPIRQKEAAHYGKTALRFNTSVVTERHPTSVLPAFPNGSGGTSIHETAKPLDLIMWLVSAYSNPGDLVLDPFMGSGPVVEACKRLGRRCVGIDNRIQCVEIAARRLQQNVFAFDEAPV